MGLLPEEQDSPSCWGAAGPPGRHVLSPDARPPGLPSALGPGRRCPSVRLCSASTGWKLCFGWGGGWRGVGGRAAGSPTSGLEPLALGGPGNSFGRRAPPRTPPAGLPWGIAGPPEGPAGGHAGPLGLAFRRGRGEVGLHSACERCTSGCGGWCPESGGCLGLEASDFLGPLEPNPGAFGTQQSERGQAPSLLTARACWPFCCSQGPGSLPEPTLSEPLALAVEAEGGVLLQ